MQTFYHELVNQQVAVYGTLRQGCGNHGILYGLPKADDRVQGYKMHSLGGFPYVFETGDPSDEIIVEVYTVPDETTARRLDALEGYTNGYAGFYDRVSVRTVTGRQVWMYVFRNEEVGAHPVVPNGDWKLYAGSYA